MKVLYLDIETAPHRGLFWGTFKQNISIDMIEEPGYILCWAAKWEDKKEVLFSSVKKDGYETMLHKMWALLDNADVVVHYYGKSFDIPWINGQFAKLGLVPPSNYKQCDLCQEVRRNFKLASSKLDFVLHYFGLGNKVKTPGVSMWKGCMAGDAKAWSQMERYNKQDVRVLPKLKKYMLPWIKWPAPLPLYAGDGDERACPNCGKHTLIKRGIEYPSKAAAYHRLKCTSCGTNARSRLAIKTQVKPGAV